MNNRLHTRLVRLMAWWHLPAPCLLLCMVLGCSDRLTVITGDVNLDGKPLKVAPNIRGTVVFQPTNHKGPILNGLIGRSGHFQLAAGSSRAIQPGVYLATVSAVQIEPAEDGNSLPSGKRITPAKYASSDTSGLRVEVKPGENHIVLDLESSPPTADADDSAGGLETSPSETESVPNSASEAPSPASVQEPAPQEKTDAVEQGQE